MNEEIKGQILNIRDSGVTNMFDINKVQYEAFQKGYYELVDYLEVSKEEYTNFILTGEVKK